MSATAPEPGKYRLFIAMPVPTGIKEELNLFQKEFLDRLGKQVRWIRPEQIHLTLSFLGDVPAGNVGDLVEATRNACNSFAPIQLSARGIAFWPQIHNPRVICALVRDLEGKLSRLQMAVAAAAARFTAHREEHAFAGHLTIGRVRRITAQINRFGNLAKETADRVFGEWTANTVEVMRSELSKEGVRYSALAEIELR
jgi:2'-5' RNA ligase